MSTCALGCIALYQRHLSPRKKFGCVYRERVGSDMGCSGFAKHAIRDFGIVAALPLIKKRLSTCKSLAKAPKGGLTCPKETSLNGVRKNIQDLENINFRKNI